MQDLWVKLRELFGIAYADSFARDHVMSELDGRTVNEALRDGVAAKDVWLAVAANQEIPAGER